MLEVLIVFVVVTCCFGYSAWTLLPPIARREVAKRLLRLPLKGPLRFKLEMAARASAGCHCSGCDRAVIKPESQPLLFHPRKR
jgi:hypothetical protein